MCIVHSRGAAAASSLERGGRYVFEYMPSSAHSEYSMCTCVHRILSAVSVASELLVSA
jgi:hypothetical protein